MFADHHHDDGRLAIWVAAPAGAQEALTGADPVRFFRPPYVGVRGWIGVRLDTRPDWDHIAALILDAYRATAPVRILRELDAAPAPAARNTCAATEGRGQLGRLAGQGLLREVEGVGQRVWRARPRDPSVGSPKSFSMNDKIETVSYWEWST